MSQEAENLLVLETLIVWTDSDGLDMALSFQEADGCSLVWYGQDLRRIAERRLTLAC